MITTKKIMLSVATATSILLVGCGGVGSDGEKGYDSERNLLNEEPVAIIDSIRQQANGVVLLDGHSSYDRDGYIKIYSWKTTMGGTYQTSEPIAKISGLSLGEYFVELTVYDNENHKGKDTDSKGFVVNIPPAVTPPPVEPPVVTPPPIEPPPIEPPPVDPPSENKNPVAKGVFDPTLTADKDGVITVGENFGLNASDSYDPDGTIVEYKWDVRYKDSTATDRISTQYGETSIFPNTLTQIKQTIQVVLSVTDDKGGKGTYSFPLNIEGKGTPPPTDNKPPVADAGADTVLGYYTPTDKEALVELDGTKSYDSDGTITDYWWTNDGTGISYNGAKISVSFNKETSFTLKVIDNDGASDKDTTFAERVLNSPPVADAGNDKTIIISNNRPSESQVIERDDGIKSANLTSADGGSNDGSRTVHLDGTQSSDDGHIRPLTFSWKNTTGNSIGVTPTLLGEDTATPSFVLSCDDDFRNTAEGSNCRNMEGERQCVINYELTVNDGQQDNGNIGDVATKVRIEAVYKCSNGG